MNNKTKNMIDAATNKDGAAFKAAFDTLIQQKVGDTLEAQRVEVAKNVFGNIRVPATEQASDEVNEVTIDLTKIRKLTNGTFQVARRKTMMGSTFVPLGTPHKNIRDAEKAAEAFKKTKGKFK